MDIDPDDQAAGWLEAEQQMTDGQIQKLLEEKKDPDSALEMLYGLIDTQLSLEGDEPEETIGGTDDAMHARAQDEPEPEDEAPAADAGAGGTLPAGNEPDAESLPLPREHAAIPKYDLHGFTVLTLVHDNGVHGLGVNFCRCQGHAPEHEQLLMHGLFPASTIKPSTAYDTESLEKALVDETECHTRTESYWKKIARLTVPEDPTATVVSLPVDVPLCASQCRQNKYAVTTRVQREYRALKAYTDFGFAHQDVVGQRVPGPGDMAYSCIACPQIWNVPENFDKLSPDRKALYFHAWSIDGNMKAEHTTSRRPGNNVQIFPGTGFFPDPEVFAKNTEYAKTDKSLPRAVVRTQALPLLAPGTPNNFP